MSTHISQKKEKKNVTQNLINLQHDVSKLLLATQENLHQIPIVVVGLVILSVCCCIRMKIECKWLLYMM